MRSRTIDSAFRYFAAPVVLIAEALAITVLLDQFGSPAGYRKIPLIFITTHSDEEEWAQALRDGAVAFLYKSFSFPDLRDAIDAALSQSFR